MFQELVRYTRVLAIVGDILKVRAKKVGFGDLALVENWDGEESLLEVSITIAGIGPPFLQTSRQGFAVPPDWGMRGDRL